MRIFIRSRAHSQRTFNPPRSKKNGSRNSSPCGLFSSRSFEQIGLPANHISLRQRSTARTRRSMGNAPNAGIPAGFDVRDYGVSVFMCSSCKAVLTDTSGYVADAVDLRFVVFRRKCCCRVVCIINTNFSVDFDADNRILIMRSGQVAQVCRFAPLEACRTSPTQTHSMFTSIGGPSKPHPKGPMLAGAGAGVLVRRRRTPRTKGLLSLPPRSSYHSMTCVVCEQSVGRVYVTASRQIEALRDNFSFDLDAVDMHQLGRGSSTTGEVVDLGLNLRALGGGALPNPTPAPMVPAQHRPPAPTADAIEASARVESAGERALDFMPCSMQALDQRVSSLEAEADKVMRMILLIGDRLEDLGQPLMDPNLEMAVEEPAPEAGAVVQQVRRGEGAGFIRCRRVLGDSLFLLAGAPRCGVSSQQQAGCGGSASRRGPAPCRRRCCWGARAARRRGGRGGGGGEGAACEKGQKSRRKGTHESIQKVCCESVQGPGAWSRAGARAGSCKVGRILQLLLDNGDWPLLEQPLPVCQSDASRQCICLESRKVEKAGSIRCLTPAA